MNVLEKMLILGDSYEYFHTCKLSRQVLQIIEMQKLFKKLSQTAEKV